ncbi:uncharacterized protein MYCFIDRAFT_180482 [Pseudocercospora fijiensis CIRAD86]|uniref:Uncharacterized protein n=1 Tax=Pseudocercospora fijiensis (strain CIRAD86) TaxID=383855 RepID=M3AIG4_PSEFD|nr:uncharacterized protein MYCFIDRAFT_180482 [Pseudocercospora fijiensis CIRAD86]EME76998.1 hypothetical protein MYCFIDRAFT_180482 [Pseudocercospora fijiensis CIRAD86]
MSMERRRQTRIYNPRRSKVFKWASNDIPTNQLDLPETSFYLAKILCFGSYYGMSNSPLSVKTTSSKASLDIYFLRTSGLRFSCCLHTRHSNERTLTKQVQSCTLCAMKPAWIADVATRGSSIWQVMMARDGKCLTSETGDRPDSWFLYASRIPPHTPGSSLFTAQGRHTLRHLQRQALMDGAIPAVLRKFSGFFFSLSRSRRRAEGITTCRSRHGSRMLQPDTPLCDPKKGHRLGRRMSKGKPIARIGQMSERVLSVNALGRKNSNKKVPSMGVNASTSTRKLPLRCVVTCICIGITENVWCVDFTMTRRRDEPSPEVYTTPISLFEAQHNNNQSVWEVESKQLEIHQDRTGMSNFIGVILKLCWSQILSTEWHDPGVYACRSHFLTEHISTHKASHAEEALASISGPAVQHGAYGDGFSAGNTTKYVDRSSQWLLCWKSVEKSADVGKPPVQRSVEFRAIFDAFPSQHQFSANVELEGVEEGTWLTLDVTLMAPTLSLAQQRVKSIPVREWHVAGMKRRGWWCVGKLDASSAQSELDRYQPRVLCAGVRQLASTFGLSYESGRIACQAEGVRVQIGRRRNVETCRPAEYTHCLTIWDGPCDLLWSRGIKSRARKLAGGTRPIGQPVEEVLQLRPRIGDSITVGEQLARLLLMHDNQAQAIAAASRRCLASNVPMYVPEGPCFHADKNDVKNLKWKGCDVSALTPVGDAVISYGTLDVGTFEVPHLQKRSQQPARQLHDTGAFERDVVVHSHGALRVERRKTLQS